jgi:hypothetical protein
MDNDQMDQFKNEVLSSLIHVTKETVLIVSIDKYHSLNYHYQRSGGWRAYDVKLFLLQVTIA